MSEIQYFASEYELYVKKGQRVYPYEEAYQMANKSIKKFMRDPVFKNYKFWAKGFSDGGFFVVLNQNVPEKKTRRHSVPRNPRSVERRDPRRSRQEPQKQGVTL